MSKKSKFIEAVNDAFFSKVDLSELDPDVVAYWEALKGANDVEKPTFTDNGKLILKAMKDNIEERANMFSAKQIAEYAFISSRQVSGAIRKLVTDGYCEKAGQDPIIYSLTDLGREAKIDD